MFGLFSKKKKAVKPAKKKAAAKSDSKKAPAKKAGSKKKATSAKKPTAAAVAPSAETDAQSDQDLIREALGAAEAEIGTDVPAKRKPPIRRRADATGPVTERDKIIQQALAIQRAKSSLLDDLDPKMKAKVQQLAINMLSKPTGKPDA